MKTLLALLLFIPSLSWGIDYDRKDIPLTKTELNYLYDYELGTIFDENQLTKNGLKEFNEQINDDKEEPYLFFSRKTNNDSNDSTIYELKFNILNEDFDIVGLNIDSKTLSIDSIYLYKEIVGEDIRNQISGLMGILDMKEIEGVNLTTCEEFKSTVINAYRFKRGIKENLKDYYEYYISNESGKKKEIKSIASYNLIKDKNNNILEAYCSYASYYSTVYEERKFNTYFILSIRNAEYIDNYATEFNSKNETIEIERSEFKNLLSIFFELNTDGL